MSNESQMIAKTECEWQTNVNVNLNLTLTFLAQTMSSKIPSKAISPTPSVTSLPSTTETRASIL